MYSQIYDRRTSYYISSVKGLVTLNSHNIVILTYQDNLTEHYIFHILQFQQINSFQKRNVHRVLNCWI